MSMFLRRERCLKWRLYAITCPKGLSHQENAARVEAAIRGGASVVQVRDKRATDQELLRQACELLPITRRLGVPLIVNDRPRVAKEVGADGVHLGQEDGSLSEARSLLGEEALIGRSTHSPEQALAAEKEGFDYIGVGPIYATPTKPGRSATGLEFIRFAAANLRVPFVAIGGIGETNLDEVLEAGALRVAFVRALLGRTDPEEAAKKLMAKIQGRSKNT